MSTSEHGDRPRGLGARIHLRTDFTELSCIATGQDTTSSVDEARAEGYIVSFGPAFRLLETIPAARSMSHVQHEGAWGGFTDGVLFPKPTAALCMYCQRLQEPQNVRRQRSASPASPCREACLREGMLVQCARSIAARCRGLTGSTTRASYALGAGRRRRSADRGGSHATRRTALTGTLTCVCRVRNTGGLRLPAKGRCGYKPSTGPMQGRVAHCDSLERNSPRRTRGGLRRGWPHGRAQNAYVIRRRTTCT